MAILAECPRCHRKQGNKNKQCSCGEDLVKAKRGQRVRYWITYRVDGKQRKEAVGLSIEEARDADGKRRGRKRENRIFEMLPEAKMTFKELTGWYIELPAVKKLKSKERIQAALTKFNDVFVSRVVNTIKSEDLEAYQAKRAEDGRAPATIQIETTVAKTVINKAFENDLIDGRILKAFKRVKGVLKIGANARERTLTIGGEYLALVENAPQHLQGIITTAFHTGMRVGEIQGLQWSWVDRAVGFIRIPAEATKEGRAKSVPINRHVKAVLDSQPRALHHDYVFNCKGKPRGEDFRHRLMRTCDNAGIIYGQKVAGGFRFHDIRATFDTNMDSAGVSESRRKAILGHALRGMDRHYIRPKDAELREAMDRYTA